VADKVLIVDDVEAWYTLLHQVLANAGYDCSGAKDPKTALELLQKILPAALVLDLQLGESESTEAEFQGWILAQEALKLNIPVVVVTAHASVPLANEAFRKYKVLAFLEKSPFNRESLLSATADGIKESRLRRLSEEETDNAIAKIRDLFRRGSRINK